MISVIIPTFNEEDFIASIIEEIRRLDPKNLVAQIIVADGYSADNTCIIAKNCGAQLVLCPKKGRAAQMNFASTQATENILYFIHADTIPPAGFAEEILEAVNSGIDAGSFKLKFDCNHWFLKVNAWFTRFDIDAVRFGDQSLFVTKAAFQKVDGFSEQLIVMEDQHIIKKLKKQLKFKLLNKAVVTSSRKYIENGVYKTQAVFFLVFLMYELGFPQTYLIKTYRRLLKQDKV